MINTLCLLLALPLTLEPGQQLARDMRHTKLLHYEQINGTLQTKNRRGRRTSQHLHLHVRTEGDQQQSTFTATNQNSGNTTQLTILRSPKKAPRYLLAPQAGQPPAPLPPKDAMKPFAQSNFWPADLGLEFFYWPKQNLLTNIRIKMRKGISCFVLESRKTTDHTFGYNRVRSWISREHLGLIYAEAYNARGQRIKTFEVADVEKINGEWKIRELRIRDEIAKSTTKLIFDNRPPN